MKHIKQILIAISVVALLVACSGGGGDATAPEETSTGGTSGSTPTDSAATEPTTGYGYVTNPAGGNYGIQCAKDYATGLIWEGKNPNPSHSQGIGRTYTNYDNADKFQGYNVTGGGGPTWKPLPSEISAVTNTIGYKNAINSQALCGFTDWRLPTEIELKTLGKISSKLADFPETTSSAYWSSGVLIDDELGVIYSSAGDAYLNLYRSSSYSVRLVRSSR